MNLADSKDELCQNSLNKIYSDLLHLITSFEKGSGSELTVRLRQVESGLEQLRESIRSIPDIQNNEQRQRDKIASLYRFVLDMLIPNPRVNPLAGLYQDTR
ncbi:unnamed protein product [Angiostrongylus costaricensis]|uniref:Mediator of RNA polymerase II transcription subunit 9 n=1 Tax=Angiostrongylus costaricensis TaxID=334426 RepID=A0A158PEF8_ANGCS|nr:unnamed protein product [Angiostrongylus costaricensis]